VSLSEDGATADRIVVLDNGRVGIACTRSLETSAIYREIVESQVSLEESRARLHDRSLHPRRYAPAVPLLAPTWERVAPAAPPRDSAVATVGGWACWAQKAGGLQGHVAAAAHTCAALRGLAVVMVPSDRLAGSHRRFCLATTKILGFVAVPW
jgi:hypothetical protein